MANLTITEADVRKRPGAVVLGGTSGTIITAGDAVTFRESDGLVYTTTTNSAISAAVDGVALNAASLNQPVDVLIRGDMNLGATLVIGTIYTISSSSGRIRPSTDAFEGDQVSIIGIATTVDNLNVKPHASGVGAPA